MKNLFHKVRSTTSAGFTLIELLAAMAVLVFLVLMLTQVYTEGANAWKAGSRSTYRNMHARAVMDFMARELSMSAFEFGNNPSSKFLSMGYNANVTPNNFGLEGADEIFFVRLNKTPGSSDEGDKRSAQLLWYYVDDYVKADGNPVANAPLNPEYMFRLMRAQKNPTPDANSRYGVYFNNTAGLYWMGQSVNNPRPSVQEFGEGEMIPNVRTFEVFTYTNELGESQTDWRSYDDKLAFIDIYLETFDEKDAIRAAALADNLGQSHATVVEFVERAVKRNYRRVYLYNKQGYQDSW